MPFSAPRSSLCASFFIRCEIYGLVNNFTSGPLDCSGGTICLPERGKPNGGRRNVRARKCWRMRELRVTSLLHVRLVVDKFSPA